MVDYDSLYRRRKSLERDQGAVEGEITQLQKKLTILDDAYTRLKEEKARFGRIKTAISDAYKRVSYWQGNNYNAFTNEYNNTMGDCEALHGQIDRILDNINWKRNDLNRQIAYKQSLLKGILSNLRSIGTQWENWNN